MSDSISIETIEPRLYASVVAEEIALSISEAVDARGVCTLALAGGRTPGKVYRTLAIPPLSADLPWDKIILILGDERWVPVTDNQSNAHMVHETLLHNVTLKEEQTCFVDTSLASPAKGAEHYEKEIRKTLSLKNDELPEIDIMLLGIGEDGHTASIFPDKPDVWNTGNIAVATVNPEGVERISLTPEVLVNARKIFFLATGESKTEIVTKAIKETAAEEGFPAQIYRRVPEKVTWFLDSESSLGLNLEVA